MVTNLMEKYIKNIKEFLQEFTKLFFTEKYNEQVSNEYINTYIDARIYNFGEKNQRFFYRRIYLSLMDKKNEMIQNNTDLDQNILEEMLKMYQFIFYIDEVREIAALEKFVNLMFEKRQKNFEITSNKIIESKILKLIKDYRESKKNIFEQYTTKDFLLNIQKYVLVDNTYKVSLDYNFKLPYIYSDKVISEVYNEGVINEDKLIIEYILLGIVCIKDINKGDFTKKYLVEFSKTLYKKEKKLNYSLKSIDNLAIQDKIVLKIQYSDFKENKELIYSLMKRGFRFAIIIDDSFNVSFMELKKLEIFQYLLISNRSKHYEEIRDYEDKINNVIIYDI